MKDDERLSRLETIWSIVNRAHGDSNTQAASARQELMARYGGAVKRYLLGALRNDEDAAEVYQEFALRIVRGDFHRADPERGRFRAFVKSAVFRLVVDFHRARAKSRANIDLDHINEPSMPLDELNESAFVESWRAELIDKTLNSLQSKDRKAGTDLFNILRIRIDNPVMRSPELAELASAKSGRKISAENFRSTLRRARLQFASMLLDEVSQSLANPSSQELESELAELNLLEYCKPALQSRDL